MRIDQIAGIVAILSLLGAIQIVWSIGVFSVGGVIAWFVANETLTEITGMSFKGSKALIILHPVRLFEFVEKTNIMSLTSYMTLKRRIEREMHAEEN